MSSTFAPRVFIHPAAFLMGKYTGISRYVCEILEEFEHMGVPFCLPLRDTDNGYLPQTSFFPRTSRETPATPAWARLIAALGRHTSRKESFDKLAMRATARKAFRQDSFELIHPTYTNELNLLEYKGRTPMVVTIHDMIHEILPEAFSPHDPTAQRKKLFAERADRIIAISQKTKDDIVEILGIDPDRIDVIYHGCSALPAPPEGSSRSGLPPRYLLFVGRREAYKNFDRFFSGVAPLLKRDSTLHLICVGGGSWTQTEQQNITAAGLQNRIHQQYADDRELARLYRYAEAFVFPSYYEGFGLPILEAFTCGAPVVCARASCFEEIGGDACAYFDPHDAADIESAVLAVIGNAEKRAEMLLRGKKRAAAFTWQKAAVQTLETYRKALNGH